RLVKAVQLATLVKQHRLGRVEILRLASLDDASTKGDDPPAGIADGKHHAIAKAIVVALTLAAATTLALDDEAGLCEAFALGDACAETAQELVPRVRRVTDREALQAGVREATLREVISRPRLARELLAVEARDACHQLIERLIGARRDALGTAFLRDLESQAGRELLHRLRKGHVIVIHEEAERSTVLAAAKAVIELLVGTHPEGGGLLGVEWAAGLVLAAGFLQRHACADELHDIGARDELVDEVLGDASQVPRT